MNTPLRNLCRASLCLAVLLVCGGRAAADAAKWVGYQNKTPAVVVVQGSSKMGVGQPHRLAPNQTAWDPVNQGEKTITVTDPKTGKVLAKETVTVADKDVFLLIQVDKNGYKVVPGTPPPGMVRKK
jgi:hypothetical protein